MSPLKWTFLLFSGAWAANAPGIDENALFADTSSVLPESSLVSEKPMAGISEEKAKAFSGEIASAAVASANRDWVKSPGLAGPDLATYMVGNLFLDVRQSAGFKAFANLEARYMPSANQTFVGLREIFLDANIQRRAYFRAGKQVLQWGRCYFWNPTDLINVEKKLFVQKIGYREGAYGLKAHVPFGASRNLYGFLDTRSAASPDSVAGAFKAEALFKGLEAAVSLWGKRGWEPVYAADFSTSLLDYSITGEIGFFSEKGVPVAVERSGLLHKEPQGDSYVPKACVGAGKQFDFLEVNDRLTVNVEFYWNGAGYEENVFLDNAVYGYAEPISLAATDIAPATRFLSGTKADFLEQSSLYETNSFSRYYLALFSSLSPFFTSDLALNANAIANLNQKAGILSAGCGYRNLRDFSLNITISAFLGAEGTEYTFRKQALSCQASAGLVF